MNRQTRTKARRRPHHIISQASKNATACAAGPIYWALELENDQLTTLELSLQRIFTASL